MKMLSRNFFSGRGGGGRHGTGLLTYMGGPRVGVTDPKACSTR